MEHERFHSVHLALVVLTLKIVKILQQLVVAVQQFLSDGRGDRPAASWDIGALRVDQADVEADLVHVPRRGRRPRVAERGRGG